MGKPRIWTLEKCRAVAARFTRRVDWQRNSASSYYTALKNGWFSECTAHMGLPAAQPRVFDPETGTHRFWTEQKCREEALKYSRRGLWRRKNPASYGASKTLGIFDECVAHMAPSRNRISWTKELCRKEAMNYGSRFKWERGSPASYQAAKRSGWIDDCALHMSPPIGNPRRSFKWTRETLLEEARKYRSRSEWNEANSYSYYTAKRLGVFGECVAHMDSSCNAKKGPEAS